MEISSASHAMAIVKKLDKNAFYMSSQKKEVRVKVQVYITADVVSMDIIKCASSYWTRIRRNVRMMRMIKDMTKIENVLLKNYNYTYYFYLISIAFVPHLPSVPSTPNDSTGRGT